MDYIKIIVKNEYEKEGDLVYRPLVRAYKKLGINDLLEGDNAILLGRLINGKVYEFFTRKLLNVASYEKISYKEVVDLVENLDHADLRKIFLVLENLIFDNQPAKLSKDLSVDDLSTMEERAMDRTKQFEAYNNNLISINPYCKKHCSDYNKFELVSKQSKR